MDHGSESKQHGWQGIGAAEATHQREHGILARFQAPRSASALPWQRNGPECLTSLSPRGAISGPLVGHIAALAAT